MKFARNPVFLLILVMLLSACGQSFDEVVAVHQSDFDQLKKDLLAAGVAVPPKHADINLVEPLDPVPRFKDNHLQESNTVVIPLEQLLDPNDPKAEIAKDKGIDLYLNDVGNFFIWAGQDDKAFDTFEVELKAAFQVRYVVVYKTLEITNPKVIDEKTYQPGAVVMGVYVYDINRHELVMAFRISAKSAEKVSYSYDEGRSATRAAASSARSSLWEATREELLKTLAEKTGGSFQK